MALVSVRIPEALAEELDRKAERMRSSRSALIVAAVRRSLRQAPETIEPPPARSRECSNTK